MKLLLVSPFHGGSHKVWAEGLSKHCRTDVRLLTLPGRFWKWRMHGGAVTLAERFLGSPWRPDLIMATDMLDLASFLALTRRETAAIPSVLYCHENQLTYPMPDNPEGNRNPARAEKTDHHYAFINISSMLAADRIIFNSDYHRREFLAALPAYLRQFPEFRLPGTPVIIRNKSAFIYPGIEGSPNPPLPSGRNSSGPPLILWNQRWEYDKNPGEFFAALAELKAEGFRFRLAVCGEQFSKKPGEILRALELMDSELIHCGYADAREYRSLLAEADIVLSTAVHEFFGIAILESILHRTFPVLPHRLSYPELLPREFHGRCLYRNRAEMLALLRRALLHPDQAAETAERIRLSLGDRFSWGNLSPSYDQLFRDILDAS